MNNNTKPPSKTYYDVWQFIDWFKDNKQVDFGPMINVLAASRSCHNGSFIHLGDSLFENLYFSDHAKERYPSFELEPLQKAFDEVFGDNASIKIYFWW